MLTRPPHLTAVIAGDSRWRVIRVQGVLVVDTAMLVDVLTTQLVREGCRSIRLDLSDVTMADRMGRRALRDLAGSLRAAGVALALANVPAW